MEMAELMFLINALGLCKNNINNSIKSSKNEEFGTFTNSTAEERFITGVWP